MRSLPHFWAAWTETSQPICLDKLSPVQMRKRLNKSSRSWDHTNMHPEFAFPSAAAHHGPEEDLHCGAPRDRQSPTCSGCSAFLGTCWPWTSRSLWRACWQTQTLQWWHRDLRSDRRADTHSNYGLQLFWAPQVLVILTTPTKTSEFSWNPVTHSTEEGLSNQHCFCLRSPYSCHCCGTSLSQSLTLLSWKQHLS